MGDTIKPRLMDAHADENRIFCIDESEKSLTLLDERIEKAIDQTGAKLIILDPVQGYVGERIDMNRANEIRTVNEAKKNIPELVTRKVNKIWLWAIPSEECNIAGCPWGRMQGLHCCILLSAYQNFITGMELDGTVNVHADGYLYGEGGGFTARPEEVAYLTIRLASKPTFLQDRCRKVVSVDFKLLSAIKA